MRRTLAIAAVVVALVAYAQYWILQHPGVKFIGDGNSNSAQYITDSGHYRGWPIAVASVSKNAKVVHAKGIHFSHNLDEIWNVKVDQSVAPALISNQKLQSLKQYLYWQPSDLTQKGWVAGIFIDQTQLVDGAEFTVFSDQNRKYYLVYPASLAVGGVTDDN